MMKTSRLFAFVLFAFISVPSFAEKLPARQTLDEWITTAEKHLVDAAAAMPEEKYGFAPTSGEFAGVRTFGEQIKHAAAANYGLAARASGETPNAEQSSETGPQSVKTKAEILSYLKGSFAALHRAAATLDDTRAATVVKGEKHVPAWFIIDAIAHSFNHYGQIVEYLRMNGIVPPASR
jgi:uncharacterized damage-inducible protein DinB